MMRLVLLKNAWKLHIPFKGIQMRRTQSDRQWSTPASHASSPQSNGVWITPNERAKSPTARTPRLPPHTPRETRHRNNHLLILHLHQPTPDASLCKLVKSLLEAFQTLPKFTLNLKHNASDLTARFQPNRTFWVQFLVHFLQSRTLTSHLQRSQFSLCISDVQNNGLQLRKALYLLEVNATTEQNEDGREAERPTDLEAAEGTLMQSISTATCGYEAQRSCGRNTGAGSESLSCATDYQEPHHPPPTLNSPLSICTTHLPAPPPLRLTVISDESPFMYPIW